MDCDENDEAICTGLSTFLPRAFHELPLDIENKVLMQKEHDHHHSGRGSKNPKPEFSRSNGGGSMSAISTCCIDLEMSSTVNGMLYKHYD